MNCEKCGKISNSIKRIEYCDNTLFHHICSYAGFCLECRIITQICIEEYDKLTKFLERKVCNFSKTITKEMELNMK